MSVGVVLGEEPVPPSTPRAIREALLPEEVGHFDRQYRQAMAAATESLDLTEVLDVLRRWQRIAVLSQDPAAHRAMLDRVARLQAGEAVPTEKWAVTKARLGL